MKLTKKNEAEVLKVYDAWLNAYINGDVKTYDFFLDDSYHFIGSTNNEEFLNRKETTKFFKKTADQLAGKTELKNRIKTIELFEGLVFITEFFDAYFLIGNEWNYYGRFRFTSVTRKNKEGWRFIYQHFSMPDSKSDDGQTIGYDKVNSENLELKEAIKRRTVELDLKNRELEIEAALEKVRSCTMAMQHSDELQETANKLFLEVQALGIPSWSCGFNILSEDKTTCKSWMSSEGKLQQPFTLIFKKEASFIEMYEFFKSDETLLMQELEGDAIKSHYDYMKSLPSLVPIFDDFEKSGIPLPTYQINHLCKFKGGYLLFITYEKVPKAHDVFKRFTKVFEQTYTRFLDLQKAEAQAREAEIELALERVRARTMAMQKSEELSEVATVLFQQVGLLGIPQWTCGFNIWETGDTHFTFYPGGPDGEILASCKVSLTEHPIFRQFDESKKRGDELLVYEKEGEIQADHYRYMHSLPGIGDMLQGMLDSGLEFPTYQIDHVANFLYGNIIFVTYEPFPEMHDVFKRFAKVFEQTYTRFLDLQKAEAQAREAQIEASLERVRARSMAMHQSDELKDVIKVIFDQMAHLNINAEHAGIVVDYEPKKDWHFWVAETQDIPARITVPYLDLVWDRQFTEAKKKGKDFFTTQLDFEEKNSFYKELLPHIQGLTKKAQDFYFSCPGLAASTVIQKDIGLYIENFSGIPYTHEENSILMRIGKVFQQTYTRFLDLQQAEAQAREAQIEAALERVRSRTMAMQHSTELSETSALLFQQIQMLGVPPWSCGFNIWEKEDTVFTSYMGSPDGGILKGYKIPLTEEATFIHFKESRDRGDKLFIDVLEGDTLETHYQYFQTLPGIKEMFEKRAQAGYPLPTFQINHLANFSHGNLMFITYEPCPEAHDIFIRFAKVFEQTYTRFLDLQKAEEQTREAQINLAVERVRAKALAMHKSEEIMEVVAKLKEEIMGLDIPDVIAATIFLSEGEDQIRMWDLSSLEKLEEGYQVPLDITFKLKEKDPHLYVKRVWENPENYFVEIQDKKGFKRIMAWLREYNKNEVADEVEAYLEASKIKCLYHAAKKLNNGKLVLDLLDPPTSEIETILTKMGTAFDLAYKRFEDLQKAEAQTREAQIEAALERVRSRSMAMHKSEELLDVISVVSEQLLQLDFKFIHVSFANNDISQDYKFWTASKGMSKPMRFNTPYLDIAMFNNLREAQKKSVSFYTDILTREEHIQWHKHLLKHGGSDVFSKAENEFIMSRGMARSIAINPNIILILANYASIPYSEDDNKIIERFGQVFEQSYTRFLDLQKAEAQAKEAKIEGALERVRSKTMAMHNSKDLEGIVITLFEEVLNLGLDKSMRCGIGILEGHEGMETRSVNSNPDGSVDLRVGMLNMTIHPMLVGLKNAWKNGSKGYSYEYTRNDLKKYYKALNNEPEYPFNANLEALPKQEFHRSFFFSSGILFAFSAAPISEESSNILARFAAVFGQTYRRFLDLQKAEAQAREALIENALEKVRSRTMAMQHSNELPEAANNLFLQVQELGIPAWSAGYCIWNENKESASCNMSSEGQIQKGFNLPTTGVGYNFYDPYKNGESFHVDELGGQELVEHYQFMRTLPTVGEILDELINAGLALPTFQIFHIVYFTYGYVMFITYESVPDAHDIFKRFGKVFEQTYTRFLDLQKAEAQAREAKIETSLERVRSRTMAMQKSEELAETSAVVFKQLLELGISPNRLFIGIIKDEGNIVEVWATNEDGSKVETQFTAHNSKNKSIKKMVDGWKQHQKSIVIDMKGKELQTYLNYLSIELKVPFKFGLEQKRRVQTIAYFSGGMIGMAASEEQPKETIELIERFAAVFNLTYTRFNDLKIAEANTKKAEQDLINLQAAKKSAEDALFELQLTQTQLIQSEKMASLGELTAGIAHEIQNPLNFVNNFSEVSKELLDEMKEELDNGNLEEAMEIMQDIIQNLEKINHHGKRADGIVKGMLQHSRSSSGSKEPTDINALADEYFRLAYHGLRAKDKSFNATMVSDFDESIGHVSVIPQDIGRVILNLITNAFYVVDEKKKSGIENYEPTVTLKTKKGVKNIEIQVIDNGNGIPDKILNKIFEPFFTTKPTGKGTGLGLSMSYDIVTKGHGGELKVLTKEGEGTEFIIVLPINKT